MKGFSILDYEAKHWNNTEYYARKTEQVFLSAIREAIQIAQLIPKIDQNKPFSFDDYPITKKRVYNLLSQLTDNLSTTIIEGITAEWLSANLKNDDFVKTVFAGRNIPDSKLAKYNQRNVEALKAFQNRKREGLNLSDRVWNYTQQFKTDMELAIDLGLDGRSANQLSQDVRNLLKEPDKLFRRVRDKRGNLKLSKAAKAYHPGQGVYRSSYKNAMRLARTEINMAYRESDYLRFQQLDFVVGFEVKRSNRKFECDVCESLKGKYPKTFKFTGWHPHCRCYVISILATEKELDDLCDNIINEKPTSFTSSNQVTILPQGYKDYISSNKERILSAKTTPYFIQDNYQNADFKQGLKLNIKM